jgi:hypothetical protein
MAMLNNRAPLPPAPTDLFDEARRVVTVQYPPGPVVAMGLAGVVAILMAAFGGYATNAGGFANSVEWLFHEPWPLFLWLCGLLLVLFGSIFRGVAFQRQRQQMLVMTSLAIILVAVGYYLRNQILDSGGQLALFIEHLAASLNIRQDVALAAINYILIGVFWLTSVQRWRRIARGQPRQTIIVTNPVGARSVPVVMPSLSEVVAGDLIAGGALTAALWGIFQPRVMGGIITFINTRQLAGSTPAACATNCPLVDRDMMIVALSLGLLMLALTSLINGLAALNAVDRTVLPHPLEDDGDEPGTVKGTEGVVETVIDTLLSAFSRQGAQTANSAWLTLRMLVWPVLILFSVIGLAVTAQNVQRYLHGFACLHGNGSAAMCDPVSLAHHSWVSLSAYALFAITGMLVAALCGALAAATLAGQWHVARNALRYLALMGLIGLLTFWIFALALGGFNVILSPLVLNITPLWPFAQPEPLTIISFTATMIYALLLAVHRTQLGESPFPMPLIRQAVPSPSVWPLPSVPTTPEPEIEIEARGDVPMVRPMSYERSTIPDMP